MAPAEELIAAEAKTELESISALAELDRRWAALGRMPAMRGASKSLVLRKPDGSLLHALEGERLLIPASTAKLLVTAAVLDQLGPQHRFSTRLEGRGYLDFDGTWNGDLVLIGGGDPSLGSGREGCLDRATQCAEWVALIHAAGINRVNGRIIGDGRLWGAPEAPGAWAWDDLGNHYAPALNALSFAENRFESTFRTPSAPGSEAEYLGTVPDLPYWNVAQAVRSGSPGTGDETYAYSAPGGREILWKGTLPSGRTRYTVKGAWPDPSLAAAAQLERALVEAGIAVDGGAVAAWALPQAEMPNADKGPMELWSNQSPPLYQLVRWTNQESLNGYAEAFLRALGQQAGDASIAGGLEALEAWLDQQARQARCPDGTCSTAAWIQADGSGLARRNRLDAGTFSALLAHWQQASWFEAFFTSLPRSGGIGTLSRVAPKAPGRLAAKSGSIGGVRGYAGYWQGNSGQWYPLVLLLNQADASGGAMRLALEPVLQALVGLP